MRKMATMLAAVAMLTAALSGAAFAKTVGGDGGDNMLAGTARVHAGL